LRSARRHDVEHVVADLEGGAERTERIRVSNSGYMSRCRSRPRRIGEMAVYQQVFFKTISK